MIYENTQELIELLKKENLWAKKELGQNFLINPIVIEKIIKAANLHKEDNILEVGPGLGILTAELLKHSGKVRSIELDPGLMLFLKKELGHHENLELEQGNALKARLPDKPYKLIANIPYYITSPLLNHFLQPKNADEKRPTHIVLLIQKEVAEKICAKTNNQSVLSLQVQIFGKPSIAQIVRKTDFYPQPKVDSAILKIDVYEKPLIENLDIFFRLIKVAFSQRRKTLQNSLKSYSPPLKAIESLLKSAEIEPTRRPQTLSLEEWGKLVCILKNTEASP